ncbi:putative membrane protein [Corynebacterium pseudotuberculosis]|nr:putative membrane protein [Corynebacterium pseudotuberculosis]
MVLTKTALLWTKKSAIALIPMYAWALGFFGLMVAGGMTGDQLFGASFRPLLLMIAGFVGGGWPLLRGK